MIDNTRTHTHTYTGNDNTQRPKLASGNEMGENGILSDTGAVQTLMNIASVISNQHTASKHCRPMEQILLSAISLS